MKRLGLLVLPAVLLACSDPVVPLPDLGPSVWAWSGPVDIAPTLTVESVELHIYESEMALVRIAETDDGVSHGAALWASYSVTGRSLLFGSLIARGTFGSGLSPGDPFPLADGERPTQDEIHTVLHWRGHEIPVVLTRVPGAVPE